MTINDCTAVDAAPGDALASMYTGRLAQASGAHVDLQGLTIAAEAFHYADAAGAAWAPMTPATLLHSIAYAVEQHHAAMLATLPPHDQQAYVEALARMHGHVQHEAGEAWLQVERTISTALNAAPCTPPAMDPRPMLVALYQAVRAWLGSPGHA
jgi:hypothetical protein